MTVVVGYVPTPTGFYAVTEAEREARALGVPLTVVNVITPIGYQAPTAADEKNLDAVVAHLEGQGIDYSVRQPSSDRHVGELLLEIADEVKARLIVLGLHRRSRVQKALMGSTTQLVILSARCPVLTVPNRDE